MSISGEVGTPPPFPDPRTWPADVRAWYRDVTGGHSPAEIFIFNSGQIAALYLQDAVTAACVLDLDASEWSTADGYPVVLFEPRKIGRFQHRLGLFGYVVHVLEPADKAKPATKAPVISIDTARKQRGESV